MNTEMDPHARATADEEPSDSREPLGREGVVTGLAVAAVAVTAVLAAVMHRPPEDRSDAPALSLARASAVQASPHAPQRDAGRRVGMAGSVPVVGNRPGPG